LASAAANNARALRIFASAAAAFSTAYFRAGGSNESRRTRTLVSMPAPYYGFNSHRRVHHPVFVVATIIGTDEQAANFRFHIIKKAVIKPPENLPGFIATDTGIQSAER